jgi:hypothetical protein
MRCDANDQHCLKRWRLNGRQTEVKDSRGGREIYELS